MAAVDDYSEFLEQLADQHQRRLSDALQTLERPNHRVHTVSARDRRAVVRPRVGGKRQN